MTKGHHKDRQHQSRRLRSADLPALCHRQHRRRHAQIGQDGEKPRHQPQLLPRGQPHIQRVELRPQRPKREETDGKGGQTACIHPANLPLSRAKGKRAMPLALRRLGTDSHAMEWRDEGALLTMRLHGESSAIIEVFTAAHGRR